MHVNEVYELFIGYSNLNPVSKEMKANGSSTLIKSKNKIIVVSSYQKMKKKQNN